MNWIEVTLLDALPKAGARVFRRPGKADIAIFRSYDDKVFALLDRCPHKGGPLSQGIVHGHRVNCPLHQWNIDLQSGQAVAPDQGCAHRFAVKIEDNRVYLDSDELAARAGVPTTTHAPTTSAPEPNVP